MLCEKFFSLKTCYKVLKCLLNIPFMVSPSSITYHYWILHSIFAFSENLPFETTMLTLPHQLCIYFLGTSSFTAIFVFYLAFRWHISWIDRDVLFGKIS